MESRPTPTAIRESWRRTGTSLRGWARQHGVSHVVVSNVLAGRCKGSIGEGHKVAVLLGLKDGVILEASDAPPRV